MTAEAWENLLYALNHLKGKTDVYKYLWPYDPDFSKLLNAKEFDITISSEIDKEIIENFLH